MNLQKQLPQIAQAGSGKGEKKKKKRDKIKAQKGLILRDTLPLHPHFPAKPNLFTPPKPTASVFAQTDLRFHEKGCDDDCVNEEESIQ